MTTTAKARISPTTQIMIGLVVGIIAGVLINNYNQSLVDVIRPFSQIFIRMIRMIIAPLLFGTLVAGIAGAGHFKDFGGMVLPMGHDPGIAAKAQSWQDIVLHTVPTSVIDAMATGDVLQIVVFSIIFAIGLGMVGEKGRPMVAWCEGLTEAMFKVTNIIMLYAPIGVGAAIAVTIGTSGLAVMKNLAYLVFTLYISLGVFFGLVFVAQAAGVSLTIGQQVTMLLTLMLTSKGVAGVPRASLVILAATLASYNLPIEGVTLILGVDAIMDMARTMVNVVGNCLASVVVAKWEGEFRKPAENLTAA